MVASSKVKREWRCHHSRAVDAGSLKLLQVLLSGVDIFFNNYVDITNSMAATWGIGYGGEAGGCHAIGAYSGEEDTAERREDKA